MKKKYLFFLIALALSFTVKAQTLNQPADWPNPDWTITGTFNPAANAFESNPTSAANFAFDDDDAGQSHEDNIAAESPIIDLTATHAAGEYSIEASADYGYRKVNATDTDTLQFEYWDADANTWVFWANVPPNYTLTTIDNNFCTIPKTTFVTGTLNIFSFTPTQLAGFKYRIAFNDSTGIGWVWGFCFDSPTLRSVSCAAPGSFVVSSLTDVTATITWGTVADITGFEYVLDEISADPTGPGTATIANSYTASDLNSETTYYFHVRTICTSGPSPWRKVPFTTTTTPMPNDFCETALDLTNETSPLSGTTIGALNNNLNTCTGGGPITTNAYPDLYYSIVVPNGSTLSIGQTDNGYDSSNVVFYGDCTNQTQIDCFDDPDNKTVVWANNTGSDQTVYWIQDGHSGSGTFTLEWSLVACTKAVATFAVNSLCETGNDEFETVTNITNLGSATSVTVADDQGYSQTVSTTGPVVLGPYGNDTPVIITVTNDQDGGCVLTSSTLNQIVCPPSNDTCETAIDLANEESPLSGTTVGAVNNNLNTCTGSGPLTTNAYPDVYYSIVVPNGSTLSIGQTENGYDSSNVVFYGDCENRTQIDCFDDPDDKTVVWANSTGSDQTVYWIQDGHSGSGTYTLEWSVVACTRAVATFAVNSLCSTGNDEFETVTNITSLGSATSVTVADDQGYSQTVSTTGPVVLGPYGNDTPVIITVTNDQDGGCVLTSSTLNQTVCPPANDNCIAAEELTVNEDFACGTVTPGTVAGATASTVAGNTCSGNPDDDVWYSFTATNTSHRISLLNVSGFFTDMYHSLWTGDCGNLTLVPGSCSDANTSNPTGLVPGQIYYVRVYTYSGTPQNVTFNICIGTPPPPPTNETCETAIDLANETSPISGTTESALNDNLNTCTGTGPITTNTYPDVYYSIAVPNGSTLSIGQTENGYDSSNVVFYGDCENRTQIDCFNDPDDKTVVWSNTTGSTQTVYWIQDGYSGSGTFTLAWSIAACIPPAATYEINSLCETGSDGFESVTNITSLGSATSVTVADDQGNSQSVSVTGPVVLGPYENNTPVIVTITNDQVGGCSITSQTLNQITCPLTNDDFVDAEPITCGDTYTGDTELATLDESDAPDGGGADLDARNVWYSYTGSGTEETVTLNLCGSDYDTSVLVYTGTSGNLTYVAANDDAGPDACGGEDFQTRSLVNFHSDGTTTYYITIEGWNSSNYGVYSMEVSCAAVVPPAVENQSCDLALAIPVDGTAIDSDNSYGTVNPVQPSCDTFGSIQDVWFSFVAPASGGVDCSITAGTMTSMNFNIYSGTCGDLTSTGACTVNITSGGTSGHLDGLTGGDTYYVQVWSGFAEQGTFSIAVADEDLAINNPNSRTFKAYPNPVKDVLNLSYSQNISNIEVFNLLGQQVLTKAVNANQGQVDMSNLAAGTYLVKVTADNQIRTIKIEKQ